MLGPHFEGVRHQLPFLDLAVKQDHLRNRLVVVELRDERCQHLFGRVVAVMLGIPDRRPPVLAGAEEEGLHRRCARLRVNGEHIRFHKAVRIDALALAHGRQCADAVTQKRCALIIRVRRRAFHLRDQLFLQRLGIAVEEALGLAHQIAIFVERDQSRARRRAPSHLMQHAGPRARGVDIVRACAQQECLLQRVQRVIHSAGRCEWSEVSSLGALGSAMFQRLRRFVVLADQNVRKALVVAQDDVEAWFQLLDQVRFEQ